MKKESYLKQIRYESWANNMVIDAFSKATFPLERTHQIISHNLNAFSIWLKRIKDEEVTLKLWDLHTVDELSLLNLNLYSDWSAYICTLDDTDFERKIHFTFMGKKASISIEDLIIHLVNHSSYHRGQVILQLKGKLPALPLSTYIAFATNIETD
ncbi:DinB family protein [Flavobacterium soyangense]|uniref:DinB family protein n=1 Tax=Flavobacterium soyangense TaxID=2023265 RepID=A0A930Y034_9FLAO|nr:DinB family protein [Flavobacterium soyangense]MBF2708064.1 DinB family protein [Flavobacterium soyangense]